MFPFNITNPGFLLSGLPTSLEGAFLTNLTGLSYANGDILYYNSGAIQRLPVGSDTEVLTLVSGLPSWEPSSGGFSDPLTTNGDIIARIAGTTTRLAQGGNGTFLGVSGGVLGYYTPSGTGDVVGPASAVNNRVVFFDGTTGKLIKDSGLTLSGSNTGDQTSIVGITGTKTQFDTALTDGNFMYIGDAPTAHTHTLVAITDVTMTVANLNSLDDGADTTLHFHASDRSRANHTGTQLASTISDFTETAQDAIGAMLDTTLTYVDGTPLLQRAALTGAITAAAGSNTTSLGSFTKAQLDTAVSDGNVLYVGDVTSNATHTGEVTGSGALTVDKTAITNKTDTVITASDRIIFADASDTDNLKSDTVQGILDLVTVGSNTYFNDIYIDQSGGTSDTYGVITGTINGSNALFTVSQSVYATGTLKVWLNGQLMTQGTGEDFVETTPASGTFTFNTAPATGSLITVEYQKVVTNSDTIGNVQGPASATDNAIARYDSTSGKLIQNSAMTVDDAGAFTATDGSKVTGATTGAFGYIVLAVENTDDEGRAELSLDTDDGAYAGFIAMGGSNASGTPRRLDIGTRVNGPIGFWTYDTIRAQMEATGGMEFYHEVTVPHEVFDDTAWSTSPLVPTQQAVRDRFRVAVVRVIHGSTAGTTRPDTPYVEWVGSVEPTNATNNDTWVVTP